MIYGSSTINLTNQGSCGSFTGPTGPIGQTGPTGPTGGSITGPKGPTGYGITGATYNISSPGVTFYIENISPININLRGPSGANGTGFIVLNGVTTNGTSILISEDLFEITNNEVIIDQDETAYFKSILFDSINGEIQNSSETSSLISVHGKTYDIYPMGNTGEILYLTTTNEARGARGTSWDAQTNQLFFTLDATRLPIYDNDNVIIDLGTIFDFGWPIPGQGITQGSETVFTQNILGATYGRIQNQIIFEPPLITNSLGDYVQDRWKYIVGPDNHSYFYYKTFLGQSGGENLYYFSNPLESSPTSKFLPQRLPSDYIGSCCLCSINDPTNKKCIDYVGKEYCIKQGGQFSTRSCEERDGLGDCFTEGACCSNNKCNNTSFETCSKFGGVFYPNELCGKTIVAGKEVFNCPSSCPSAQKWACCVKGRCYNLSEAECVSIPDSTFLNNTVCIGEEDIRCCNIPSYSGACCYNKVCVNNTHPGTCKQQGGVFMGLGTQCEEISCCGVSYTPDYYIDDLSCRASINDACYEVGTRVGGGYLVGIIGVPNPCEIFQNPRKAFGEPVECLCNPRGNVQGDLAEQWKFKNCKKYVGVIPPDRDEFGNIFTASQEYVARTHPLIPEEASFANKCLFKGGAPYIHQLTNAVANGEGVTWPHASFFFGTDSYDGFAGPWAFDNQTCNAISEVSGLGTPSSELYKYLSEKFYGSRSVHIAWALIMAPEDVKYELNSQEEKQVSWSGMFETRLKGTTPTTRKYFIEPVSTCIVDGLLSTRLHDAYSKSKPELWFRDYNGDGKDENCYRRFDSDLKNLWPSNANRQEVESDINEFKYQYTRMWDNQNSQSTAVKQISLWNEQNKYGFDDWYIPSITELNYIAANFDLLNQTILLNGDLTHEPLSSTEYWSSTSVGRVATWDDFNHTNKRSYVLESTANGVANNQQYSGLLNSLPNIPVNSVFDLAHQNINGQGMLVQNFNDINNPQTYLQKRTDVANLRPVRRIPIVLGISNLDIPLEYDSYDFSSCKSCLGYGNSGSTGNGGSVGGVTTIPVGTITSG